MVVILLELVGVILLGIGLWLWSPAAAMATVGVLIILFAQAVERDSKKKVG